MVTKRATEKVAVVLNGNAKSVTPKVIERVKAGLKLPGKVFVSERLDQVPGIVQTIIEDGYDSVLTGGGDGTFTVTVTEMVTYLQSKSNRNEIRLPRFGILKLGTGNALAWMVGSAPLGQKGAELHELPHKTQTIRLVESEGLYSPFSGAGADARILADYAAHKSLVKRTPFSGLGTGLTGYTLASITRSLPNFIANPLPEVKIINTGHDAYPVGQNGIEKQCPIKTGEVIYEGKARLCGLGTIPYYGFKMKMFPFALSDPARMHLRITSMGPTAFLAHLSSIWKGQYEQKHTLHDYLVEKVAIELPDGTNVQVGGDPQGTRNLMEASVSPFTVDLIDFNA